MTADRRAAEEKVTVIIPAYNAEATIRETLDGVSAQSHAALEIFAVDDGSSDGTADAIADLARLDGRIRLIRQANAGVAAARNAGLAQATGHYAAWLDADDLWHPDKIAAQLDVFRTAPEPLGLVYTGYRLVDPRGVIRPNFRTLADISGHTLCRQIGTTYFTNVSSIMVPVDLARRCGGHDPRLRAEGIEGAEDLLLQLRISARAPVGMRPEAFVAYRIHGANMSRAIGRAARSNLRVLEWIAEETPDVPDHVFRMGRGRMAGFALQMIRAGDVSGGLASACRARSRSTARNRRHARSHPAMARARRDRPTPERSGDRNAIRQGRPDHGSLAGPHADPRPRSGPSQRGRPATAAVLSGRRLRRSRRITGTGLTVGQGCSRSSNRQSDGRHLMA